MNQIAWQIFGGTKAKANTFIGGVASTITTSGALATKLGIASNRITNFKIVGSDIECLISGEYTMTDGCWNGDSLLTYYKDNDGLVVNPSYRFMRANANLVSINFPKLNSLNDECFVNTNAIEEINLPLLTTMSGSYGAIALNSNLKRIILPQLVSSIYSYNSQFWYSPRLTTLYIPRCTNLGTTQGRNDGILTDSNLANLKIYAHPSLQTSNGGGVEGDLAFAISNGATVRYVTNFTAPNPITNLSVGFVYGTAVQLNFTAPSSTNAIDYYELWQNGINTGKRITASGEYVVGLTLNTAYTFQLIPVDIFFNKSTSNTIATSTLSTYYVPTTGLVAYYKLDEISAGNAVDTIAGNNLVNTNVAINQSGKIGQSYQANGINQHLNSTSFPFITTNISFNLWVYRTGTGAGTYPQLIGTGSYATNSGMAVFITPAGDLGWIINQDYNHWSSLSNIPLNTWSMVTVTYNGSNVKTYINSILKRTDAKTGTIGSTSLFRMFSRQEDDGTFVGKIDEVAIYNIALTQTEIDLLYNSGNAITL